MSERSFSSPSFALGAVFAVIVLFGFAVYAWTGPTASPPNNNVAAPINVGSAGQVKQGDFATLGNLGVGTPSPSQKLDVAGYAKANGFCIGSSCITSWPQGSLGGQFWIEDPTWEQSPLTCPSGSIMVGISGKGSITLGDQDDEYEVNVIKDIDILCQWINL